MSNDYRKVALFVTDKKKNKDVGHFRDPDYGYIGSIPQKWDLEIVYAMTEGSPTKRLVRVYYSGSGKHPFSGNLNDDDVCKREFTDPQESFDYLASVLKKYGPVRLRYATPEIRDTWNGTRVLKNCGKTYKYITETLMDEVGFDYDDDFNGIKNFRGSKPEPTPLYLSTEPRNYLMFVRYNGELCISCLMTTKFNWTKKGESKSRAEFYFHENGNGPGGTRGSIGTVVNMFSRHFKQMLDDNYCFGNVIPELVEIASACVKYNQSADFPLTQEDFDTLFGNAEVIDTVDFVTGVCRRAAVTMGFEDEKHEKRFYRDLEEYTGPIDVKDYPTLAKLAKV